MTMSHEDCCNHGEIMTHIGIFVVSSPESLHLASQSGSRRKACQRRSSLARLAETPWPAQKYHHHDNDAFVNNNDEACREDEEEGDLDPHGDILAWSSLHPLITITSKGRL